MPIFLSTLTGLFPRGSLTSFTSRSTWLSWNVICKGVQADASSAFRALFLRYFEVSHPVVEWVGNRRASHPSMAALSAQQLLRFWAPTRHKGSVAWGKQLNSVPESCNTYIQYMSEITQRWCCVRGDFFWVLSQCRQERAKGAEHAELIWCDQHSPLWSFLSCLLPSLRLWHNGKSLGFTCHYLAAPIHPSQSTG